MHRPSFRRPQTHPQKPKITQRPQLHEQKGLRPEVRLRKFGLYPPPWCLRPSFPRSEHHLENPKIRPRAPPRGVQDSPKLLWKLPWTPIKTVPKITPLRGSPQERPRAFQEAPRGSQDIPKTRQEDSKRLLGTPFEDNFRLKKRFNVVLFVWHRFRSLRERFYLIFSKFSELFSVNFKAPWPSR